MAEGPGHDPNEPQAIRALSKKELYKLLSETYFLPDVASKGVNRRYLARVYTGENYRVETLAIKRFEAEILPQHSKTTPFVSPQDLMQKVDRLLLETNQRTLGFAAGLVPEEKWLIRIARHFDQLNLTGVFAGAIPNAPQLQTDSARMLRAKRNCEQFMVIRNGLIHNPRVHNDITTIWEAQKRFISKQNELAALRRHVEDAQARFEVLRSDIESSLLRASWTLLTAGHQARADEMMNEQGGGHHRAQIQEIIRL
jgi:hypothetical protein